MYGLVRKYDHMSHIHNSIQASVREVKPESFRVEIVSLHVQCLCVLLCPSLSTCYENRLIQHVNNHTKIISMHAAIYMWEDSLFFEPIQHKYFFYFSRYIEKNTRTWKLWNEGQSGGSSGHTLHANLCKIRSWWCLLISHY